MGILDKLLKRDLTPEEQEERSRKEKEWAEKYYRAGERFGERIGLRDKVDAVNRFGNRYPKTFFSIILALLVVSFGLNYMISTTAGIFRNEAENFEAIGSMSLSGGETGKESLNAELQAVIDDIKQVESELDVYFAKDSLTHADSIAVRDLLVRMKGLQDIIGVK